MTTSHALLIAAILTIVLAPAAVATDCADHRGGLRCVSSLEVPAYPSGLAELDGYDDVVVKGNTAYAYQSYMGLRVIDLSDPTQPRHRGLYAMSNRNSQCAVVDHYVMVLLNTALGVIDADDADAPVYASHLLLPGTPSDIVLTTGRRLLVAAGDAGLLELSADNPLDLQITASLDLGGPVEWVDADGDLAVATVGRTLHVIDTSLPGWPQLLGSLQVDTWYDAGHVDLEGDLALVPHTFGCSVVDLSQPTQPTKLGELGVHGGPARLVNGLAYLFHDRYASAPGIYVYDLGGGREPFDPEVLAWLPHPGVTGGYQLLPGTQLLVSISQGRRLGTDGAFGLEVLDVSDLHAAQLTGEVFNTAAEMRYEAVLRGSMCYVAKGDDLGVFDLSNPEAPEYVLDIPCGLERLDTDGDHLFSVDEIMWGNNRFRAWSLAEPRNPAQVSVLVTENYRPNDLLALDGVMYVTRHDSGLEIIDVSDPLAMAVVQPQVLASHALNQLRLLDGTLWIGSEASLLRVSLADPLAPSIASYHPAAGTLRFIARHDDRILAFVAVRDDGGVDTWQAWDVTELSSGTLLAEVRQPCYWEPRVHDIWWRDGTVYVVGEGMIDLYRWEGDGEPQYLAQLPEGAFSYDDGRATNSFLEYEGNLVCFGGEDAELRLWPLQCPYETTAVPTPGLTDGAPRLMAAPNPFNPRTEFWLAGAGNGPLAVEIFDARGRRVRRLVGRDRVVWDGADQQGRGLATGLYLARTQTAHGQAVRRVMLVR